VIEDIGPLGEFIGLDEPIEFGRVDEVIVYPLHFPRPHWPRGGAYRHGDIGIGFQQHPADGRLARTRGRGENDKEAPAEAMVLDGLIGHGRNCLGPFSPSSAPPETGKWCSAQKMLETLAALHYVALQQREFSRG
jgi:hypothetical protein